MVGDRCHLTKGFQMNDRDALTAISTKLDTLIGAETNGLQDEVPPGSSVQRTEQDGEHGRWGHDYRLANKYLEALDIGQPGSLTETRWNVLRRNTSDPGDLLQKISPISVRSCFSV